MFGFGFDRMTDKLIKRPSEILGANYYDHWDYSDAATLSVTGTDINSCTSKGLNGAVMASTGTERPKVLLGQIKGYQVADFDGINDFASVAASTGMYNFLHNTAGGTVIVISRVNDADPLNVQVLLANNGFASANIGYLLTYDDRLTVPANNRIRNFITRGVAAQPTSENLSADNALLPQRYNLIVNKVDGDAAAANRSIININGGANIANNSFANAASGTNATFNLNIGQSANNTVYFKGQMVEVLIANIQITPQQELDLKTFYEFKYGTFPIL